MKGNDHSRNDRPGTRKTRVPVGGAPWSAQAAGDDLRSAYATSGTGGSGPSPDPNVSGLQTVPQAPPGTIREPGLLAGRSRLPTRTSEGDHILRPRHIVAAVLCGVGLNLVGFLWGYAHAQEEFEPLQGRWYKDRTVDECYDVYEVYGDDFVGEAVINRCVNLHQ